MYNHLSFGRRIFIDLLTECTRFHVAIRFGDVHGTVIATNSMRENDDENNNNKNQYINIIS